MLAYKKAAAMLLVCLLALPILPAVADQGLEGVWQGKDDYGDLTLFLGGNGCVIFIYDSGTVYKQAGLYSTTQDELRFQWAGGFNATMLYRPNGNSFLLQDPATGAKTTMTRLMDAVPPELAGEWLGEGDEGIPVESQPVHKR